MNQNLTLDDIYFKDAFTQTGNKLNLEVDNAEVESISSKNNAFSLDCNGNLVVNTITTNSGSSSSLDFDAIYPIGSIYMSVSSTNPATLFGGTWTQIKDKFLLACGDTYTNNTTGGEATHTLTVAEMPSHDHDLHCNRGGNGPIAIQQSAGHWNGNYFNFNPDYTSNGSPVYIGNEGGGQAHNNMPPYLTVYVWKRIS